MIWDKLFRLSDDYLYICREADEGWNYTLYSRDSISCAYSLADGGYIDGESNTNINDIASLATHQLKANGTPIPTDLSFRQFTEQVDTRPNITIRGIRIFLSPELKKSGIEALPPHILPEVRRIIDRRLSSPILLMHNLMGWKMHFISNDNLPDTTPVSMNFWGFTPDYFKYSQEYFKYFLGLESTKTNLKAEFFIPLMMDKLIKDNTATCEVLDTSSKWFGVTYPEDRPDTVAKIQKLIDEGVYPNKLF